MTGFEQVPAVYHREVGDCLVTTICDGYMAYDTLEIMRDPDHAKLRHLLEDETRVCPPVVSINTFLIRDGQRTVLVDCGSGDIMGPTCGRLPGLMAHLGVRPEDVTDILLTHVHPDHSNGLTDPETGRKLFPNARAHVHQAEIDHWFDDAARARATERQKRVYFDAGRIQLRPWIADGSLIPFDHEHEVLPGITALPSVGHTPGHSCYILRSRGEAMIVWGDTVHVPEVQLGDPDVGMIFDTESGVAAASRRRILQRCVDEDLLVAGMHIHFPGFARIRPGYAGAYRFVQEQWFHAPNHGHQPGVWPTPRKVSAT
ncbi:MBL fold metallo-hydrolase [Paracoccus sulfuroxidans]|uniref:Glyoxylase-like metal-dependent hydrolase (Beta-lactamase superfamily II) n=1 Tax=Paracoccus sulfuroxidans TaxID=384678 RepID=A0A562NH89_9RHOB|nr:MBL fold metallo-hydrolase [Paracoccus sulfuroxidans]TWI31281.1 glyoxylase-like metal-dependent hydrolase (beta-lactamase superfamily II) [Paracoccus sulfuroxidans]